VIAAHRRVAGPEGLWVCALALLVPPPAGAQGDTGPVGGNLAATSDYLYRGVSQSDGHGALQGDLHASSSGGTFAGVWASTRDSDLAPGTDAEVQLYLGQHIGLGSAWSVTLSGRAAYYVGGSPRHSDDYQEIAAAFTWLDRYTLSLAVIPNAVRYSPYPSYYYVYRSAALVADGAGQWLLRGGLFGGNLYLTAAAGYYYSSRPDHGPPPALGYLYGNAGLALEWRRWRVDVGYFATQERAEELFPYPLANRLAGTLTWQF